MRKLYLSVILVIALLLSCFPLSGCGTVSREYRDFYESLVNKDGNFRFRGKNPGDSKEAILHAEGLSGTVGEDVTGMDSTGLFRCRIPVQFPCFSFDLYRDYRTPIYEGRSDGCMTGGSYSAFFEDEAEFAAACRQVTAFLKETFPERGPFDTLEQLPESEKRITSPQWQTEAKDGSQLFVTFQNKISSQTASYLPKFCSIQIEVSYRKLIEPNSPVKDDRPFYQSLVNQEGNFRFQKTEPGETYEELTAFYEQNGYGKEALSPMDWDIRCLIPERFPCFDFFFYKKYYMKQTKKIENGEVKPQVENSLRGGEYTAYFYRQEDWAAACRQVIDFLKTKFPEGKSFEALEQLPEPDQVTSPQWSIEAPDGSGLGVLFQNKDLHDHPLSQAPSICLIIISVSYANMK